MSTERSNQPDFFATGQIPKSSLSMGLTISTTCPTTSEFGSELRQTQWKFMRLLLKDHLWKSQPKCPLSRVFAKFHSKDLGPL